MNKSMRRVRWVVGSGVVAAIAACSGPAPTPGSAPPPTSGGQTPSPNALVYFEGTVDVAARTMSIVTRSPSGAIQSQSTLPYGKASGDVYFHTCGAAAYNSPGPHQLSGTVQAVNLMGGSIGALNAVIDSISATGVTLGSGPGAGSSSGIIAAYGTAPTSAGDCTSSPGLPWVFQDTVTDLPFTFIGHADGTPPAVTGNNCKAILAAHPGIASGAYALTPPAVAPITAYCDMTTDGGGWTRVVGINAADEAHVNTAAVNAGGMTTATAFGKFDDATINALKSATDPGFRLRCTGASTFFGYWQSTCTFQATTDAAGACVAMSATYPPVSYVGATSQPTIVGVADGNNGFNERVIYGTNSGLTGCDTPTQHWSGTGDLWVR